MNARRVGLATALVGLLALGVSPVAIAAPPTTAVVRVLNPSILSGWHASERTQVISRYPLVGPPGADGRR